MTALSIIGLITGVVLVSISKGESLTDRLGVLVLLATGVTLRFGPVGDKVREGMRNLSQWVGERHWDGIGPDVVALLPALLAVLAALSVVMAFYKGEAEFMAVAAALLLPTLLTSVGSGSIIDLFGQVASAIGTLAGILTDWLLDTADGVARG